MHTGTWFIIIDIQIIQQLFYVTTVSHRIFQVNIATFCMFLIKVTNCIGDQCIISGENEYVCPRSIVWQFVDFSLRDISHTRRRQSDFFFSDQFLSNNLGFFYLWQKQDLILTERNTSPVLIITYHSSYLMLKCIYTYYQMNQKAPQRCTWCDFWNEKERNSSMI